MTEESKQEQDILTQLGVKTSASKMLINFTNLPYTENSVQVKQLFN